MLIEEHGGIQGIRDKGALESTLTRPIHLTSYQTEVSIHELAACYGYGLAKNHVFHDGNKRISLAIMDIFLRINGLQLVAKEVDAVLVIREVATGAMEEPDLAAWIRDNSNPLDLDSG